MRRLTCLFLREEDPWPVTSTCSTADAISPIEVDVFQTIATTSSAVASVNVPVVKDPLTTHDRLGVIATIMPGVVALDVEAMRLEAPSWIIGAPLELGLDLGGNLQAMSAGVSVGSKAFAEVGAWSRWNLSDRGLLVSV